MIPQTDPATTDLLADYRRLLERVAIHGERVQRDWADTLACRAGCAGCCQRDLTVASVEAESIRRWIAAHGLATASEGEAFVSPLAIVDDEAASPCAMLDGAGRCRIYPVRPIICRTHGLPIAVAHTDGSRAGDVCPLSFEGGKTLGRVPSADFMDVATVDTVLAAVDLRFSLAAGSTPGQRVPLRDLGGDR